MLTYAPETPEYVHRLGAAAAAKRWGTEAVHTAPIVTGPDKVVVFRVLGIDPRPGWGPILDHDGEQLLVTVTEDGRTRTRVWK